MILRDRENGKFYSPGVHMPEQRETPLIINIRPAQPSDTEAIGSLFEEFVAYLRSIGDQTPYDFGARKYLEDGFGSDPAFRGIVAEIEEGIVGYALFCKSYDGEYLRCFYLIDLYVGTRSRGQGIGEMLMKDLIRIGRTEGIRRISWAVHKHNLGAIRFYERLGASYSDDVHSMHLDLHGSM